MKKFLICAACAAASFLFFSCASLDLGDILSNAIATSTDPTGRKMLSMVEEAVSDYSPEEEYEIGRSVAASILRNYNIYNDAPEMSVYLNKICKTLVENSSEPAPYNGYRVIILDSDEINALSTPGGHIFISKGLVKCADSEDALAAIIAHELAHIQLKHGINAIKGDRIVSQGIALGKELINESDTKRKLSRLGVDGNTFDNFISNVSSLTETLLTSGFSKEQEYKADEKALMLMADAGYEPAAMLDMLAKLPAAEDDASSGWDKTHPKPDERTFSVNVNLRFISFNGTGKIFRIPRFIELINELF